ncbi:MAG TPA: isochorismatase family protein [Gemmataceae bacterium]|jgi:type 1 glutamine amidotransferase/nicotinamidase-related amidase|nr:isochorismatase family protein [Gemmataceae bacterium]
MRARFFVASISVVLLCTFSLHADPLTLTARYRVPNSADLGGYEVREKSLSSEPKQTAIVICDMWDKHWCNGATQRVGELAPRMNEVVAKARAKGVFIIHAPSECMDFYKDTPQRKLAQSAPPAKNLPPDIGTWCRKIADEPKLPIDDSTGGCDDAEPSKSFKAWKRQHEAIVIAEGDAVSDSGKEIWNLLEARGIQNVIVMGVHTNMCVLGRPFGLRQMAKNGKSVVLARDLTDAMYDPAKAPFVSHRRGTEFVIEHIEKFVCPSIHSSEIVGEAKKPHVVFLIGEDEYKTEVSLPEFAKRELEPRGIRCTFVLANETEKNKFVGLEALKDADLLVLSVRRRVPPAEQLQMIRDYLESGRPLVGIRTASHAFCLVDKPEGWPGFDHEVLGGDYKMHYGKGLATVCTAVEESAKHPILKDVPAKFESKSHLYKNKTLAKTATPLLRGNIGPDGKENEFVAWTNTYKGGRIFYTSLGSPDDFADASFRRLLRNGIDWALEREVK